MDNLLPGTQLAFDDCKSHLDASGAWGTEIESYLTQYVLVIMCADVQQEIYRAVEERADLVDDSALKNFAVASCKKVLRSVGKSEVAHFVGYFGVDAKNHLNDKIDDTVMSVYNNAVLSRHNVAHKGSSNGSSKITFRELESAIKAAKTLIRVVSEAISLNLQAVS